MREISSPPKPHARPWGDGWVCFEREGQAMLHVRGGPTLEAAFAAWWDGWMRREVVARMKLAGMT